MYAAYFYSANTMADIVCKLLKHSAIFIVNIHVIDILRKNLIRPGDSVLKCSCPSCKHKISSKAKKCPHCGFTISAKNHINQARIKVVGIVAVVIIIIAFSILYIYNKKQDLSDSAAVINETEAVTLKDANGLEFTPNEIVDRLNSFLHETNADLLSIGELNLESEKTEDRYRSIKENKNIGIFIATPKGKTSATSVAVTSMPDDNGRPTAFITYCLGLMNIFTPTMKADIRQKVLFDMMGYSESDIPRFCDENTYIIVDTKYTFTYSKQRGLSMCIEQMPELELHSGDIPIM